MITGPKGVPPLVVARLDPNRVEGICHWFLDCSNKADKDVEHPTLGWVPCCQNHINWLVGYDEVNAPEAPEVGT